MPWVKELISIIKKQRKHANFFEWPNKETKEIGVVKCLFEAMSNAGCCPYSNLSSSKIDPPDCVALDATNKSVGIEVTELVDLKTVKDAEKDEEYPKLWGEKEVIEQIQSVITKKDKKKYYGGPYSNLILVIFTDETFLSPGEVISYLHEHQFSKTEIIDEVYLLFSYDPWTHNYPYLKLTTADNIRVQGTA